MEYGIQDARDNKNICKVRLEGTVDRELPVFETCPRFYYQYRGWLDLAPTAILFDRIRLQACEIVLW